MAENPTAGLTLEEEDENIDYDSDGNPIPSTTKKIIMPLPPVDHSEVQFFTLTEHRQFRSVFSTMGPSFIPSNVCCICDLILIFTVIFFYNRSIIHPLKKTSTMSTKK